MPKLQLKVTIFDISASRRRVPKPGLNPGGGPSHPGPSASPGSPLASLPARLRKIRMSSSPRGSDGQSPARDPETRLEILATDGLRFPGLEFSGSGGKLPGVVPEVGGGVFTGRQVDAPHDGLEADRPVGEI